MAMAGFNSQGQSLAAIGMGQVGAAAVEAATDGAGPSDGGAGRRAAAAAEKAAAEKAAAENAPDEEEVEGLSQQFSDVLSPSKSPLAKRPKKKGKDGAGTSSQPIQFTESQE